MKKIISLSLLIMFIFSSVLPAGATDYSDNAARIESFKLLDLDNPKALITRGEGVRALMKLYIKVEIASTGVKSAFTDVADSDVGAPYINYAYYLGFISGVNSTQFAPDDYMTLEQFIKVAVLTLGYSQSAAEAGGYPNGYMAVAAKLGILKNVNITETGFTVENAVQVLNNILDTRPLEPVYGSGDYKVSEYTVYEQCLEFNGLKALTGRVNAVEKTHLFGYGELSDNEIMVGDKIFKCSIADRYSYLGKNVLIRYKDKGSGSDVVSIYAEGDNKEITIFAKDITNLNRGQCDYYDNDGMRTRKVNFELGATVIYNGRNYSPHVLSMPQTGSITILDSDSNNAYDVIFINEYQSFIVDKVVEKNHTIYLKDNVYFRGRNGIWFDLDDIDKEYSFYTSDGTEVEFTSIEPNDIISVWASENEDLIKVVINKSSVTGIITSIGEDIITIDDTQLNVYKPDRDAILTSVKLGDNGTFALNHENELIGFIGEAISHELYGYVVAFASGQGFDMPRIRIIGSGFKEKVVETVAGSEIIKYNYTNGEIKEFEFSNNVSYGVAGGTKAKYSASNLDSSMFNRCTISYKLDSDGRIKSADINPVPIYETANSAAYYIYSFNGKLNSFGGYVNKSAFYIGESTNVVCIPTNNSPSQADYGVDVTITGGSSCVIMPVDINADTQIASMVVLYEEMNADTPRPISSADDVSVVGKISQISNENKEIVYKLEVLKEDTIYDLYVNKDSLIAPAVASLTVGDLIRYNKKTSGEIGNIQYIESLSYLGNQYYINREGSENETVYGIVETIENDRLDDLRNERVDNITVDISGRQKYYTLLREDGPVIYTYNKRTKVVTSAISEEIQGRDRAGGGASKVFMIVNQNEPVAVINIVE